MKRDTLFLLKEDFIDGDGLPYFCPDCAMLSGVLGYFPRLRHHLDVRYVDFARPRQDIIEQIGSAHQGCPVLILHDPPSESISNQLEFGRENGRFFLSGAKKITEYWSLVYQVSRPH